MPRTSRPSFRMSTVDATSSFPSRPLRYRSISRRPDVVAERYLLMPPVRMEALASWQNDLSATDTIHSSTRLRCRARTVARPVLNHYELTII